MPGGNVGTGNKAIGQSLGVLLAALLMWPVVGVAAGSEQRVSGAEVAKLLQDEGYRAKLSIDGEGDRLSESNMAGLTVYVYFYDCEADRCGSLQFAVGMDMDGEIKHEAINDFDRQYRYARAYLDDEMDPFLQYDFEVLHTDHAGHIVSQVDIWKDLLDEFKTAVGFGG